MGIKNYQIYDKVTPDPAIETIETIKNEYEGKDISHYIGLGGGSSLDVCKYLEQNDWNSKNFNSHNIWHRCRNDYICCN